MLGAGRCGTQGRSLSADLACRVATGTALALAFEDRFDEALFTLEAIRDLIRLVTEGESPCPSSPIASGPASVPTAAATFSMNSSPFCRR